MTMCADFAMTPRIAFWACDTSIAVAALDSTHEAHAACRRALVQRRPALAGHAAFEAYSVLTRLPLPLRLNATQAASVLVKAFPAECWLDARATGELSSGSPTSASSADRSMTLLSVGPPRRIGAYCLPVTVRP